MADNSFSKKLRLLSASDFSRLKEKSESFKSYTVSIYYRSNSDIHLANSRLGISVSTKVGNAVLRNRFKRLIREKFRNSNIKLKNLDMLIVVYRPFKLKNLSLNEFEKFFILDLEKSFIHLSNSWNIFLFIL